MGICFPLLKRDRKKYNENEEDPIVQTQIIELKSSEYISCLSISSEDTWCLAQENSVSLYNDFTCKYNWESTDRVRSLCSDPNYVILANKNIEVCSHSGKVQSKLIGHERPINSLCCKNNLLISGSSDWSLRLWDLFTEQEIDRKVINWNVITCIKWAEEYIAVQGSEDLRLRIWDLREKKFTKSAVISVGDNFATCCDVSGDYIITGHRGFSGSGCDVKIWDMRKREEVYAIKEHSQSVEAVKVFDGFYYSCGKDGKIVKYKPDSSVVSRWVHPLSKPFIAMDCFKNGILTANIEPKVNFFSVNPLDIEF